MPLMRVMMIGIDIVESSRIQEAEMRTPGFLEKVFTHQEITYCQKHKDPYPRLAARFAAKEAIVKALGTGFRGIDFLDIDISHNELRKPIATLSKSPIEGKSPEQLSQSIEISLSHTKDYGTAVAICKPKLGI